MRRSPRAVGAVVRVVRRVDVKVAERGDLTEEVLADRVVVDRVVNQIPEQQQANLSPN